MATAMHRVTLALSSPTYRPWILGGCYLRTDSLCSDLKHRQGKRATDLKDVCVSKDIQRRSGTTDEVSCASEGGATSNAGKA